MAAREMMTWNPSQKRWFKKYLGRMYSVSPRQLGVLAVTKEASREAANDWWEKKKLELDAQATGPQHSTEILEHYNGAMAVHRLYAKWQRRYGSPEIAEKSEAFVGWLEEQLKTETPVFPLTGWQYDPLSEWEELGDDYSQGLWAGRMLQLMQEESISSPSVSPENTIRSHIKDYLKQREAEQEQGRMKLGTYQVLSYRVNVFNRWVAPEDALESINERMLQNYYNYLVGRVESKTMGDNHAAACMAEAKAFIRSRWELRYIDLPRNIDSRNLTISVRPKAIKTLTVAEVNHMLKETSDRLKLYLLLMLNCGMTSSDIGQLTKAEVDWKQGRIVRQRSKTRGRSENVPTVDYRLWPETFKLLKQHKSDDPVLALTNAEGGSLWKVHRTASGKVNRVDNIANLYAEWCKQSGTSKTLKLLRKTAASKLEDHPEYARYAQYFLGHAPNTVAERHYIKPSRSQFDLALAWLGQQFGVII